jgi:hypothetical protein
MLRRACCGSLWNQMAHIIATNIVIVKCQPSSTPVDPLHKIDDNTNYSMIH